MFGGMEVAESISGNLQEKTVHRWEVPICITDGGIVDVLHFHSHSIGTKEGPDPGNAESKSALLMWDIAAEFRSN